MDTDIKKILDWFLSYIEANEWARRKESIEAYFDSVLAPNDNREETRTLDPISIDDDRMGWYLYLAETSLYAIHKYEATQGSRVLPLFKRMGADFNDLIRVRGIEDRVMRLLTTDRNQADSGIFELMVALLWANNGWSEVEFIPESPTEKRPDIRAFSGDDEWFIECKRLSKSSEYSLREREKWLKMWQYMGKFLLDNRLSIVLDIVFKAELETLPDEFLLEELGDKLIQARPPCTIISNDTCEISIKTVDLIAAREHLKENYVKYPSEQLKELISGRSDPSRGFTSIVDGKIVRIGEGGGNNRYLDTLSFAAAALWHCSAERATERKARDIRKRLAGAVNQLPENSKAVIHIGLETLDGWIVEAERYSKIADTVYKFDALGKDLRWIHCHLFQPYAPPDKAWVLDETVYSFSNKQFMKTEPLKNQFIIKPEDTETFEGVHWSRENP